MWFIVDGQFVRKNLAFCVCGDYKALFSFFLMIVLFKFDSRINYFFTKKKMTLFG